MSKEPTPQGMAALKAREAIKLRDMLCETFNTLEKQGILEQTVDQDALIWWAQQKPRYERTMKTPAC